MNLCEFQDCQGYTEKAFLKTKLKRTKMKTFVGPLFLEEQQRYPDLQTGGRERNGTLETSKPAYNGKALLRSHLKELHKLMIEHSNAES